MAGFAVEDGLLKAAAATIPTGHLMVLFGAGGAVVFAVLAQLRGERLFDPAVLSRTMRIRAAFEVLGRLFYTLAITLTPLSSATVILQATPIVVVAGAAIVFREPVGWRRWTAIVLGLIGVVIIIQPGAESFSALSILAVLGMVGFAGRDLASRAAPISLGTAALGFYGFLAIIVAGLVYSAWTQAPVGAPGFFALLCLTGAVAIGVVAYSALMKAMRTGEVSAVTPFRYTRLIFGITLGLAVFGETLALPMVLGSGLIVLSGLFILWRGQKARR